jgi:hypothetical protein
MPKKKKIIDWSTLWWKFNEWQEVESQKRQCSKCNSHNDDPEWWEQQEKIMELVDKAIN